MPPYLSQPFAIRCPVQVGVVGVLAQARVCLEVVLARLRDLEPAGALRRTYTPAERDLASLPVAYAA